MVRTEWERELRSWMPVAATARSAQPRSYTAIASLADVTVTLLRLVMVTAMPPAVAADRISNRSPADGSAMSKSRI